MGNSSGNLYIFGGQNEDNYLDGVFYEIKLNHDDIRKKVHEITKLINE